MVTENNLVHRKEKLYFTLLLITSIVVYLAMFLSIVGIAILAVIFLFYWFLHNLTMVSIRKNGVKVSAQQFPAFYGQAETVAAQMKLKDVPDIYVVQSGGILNAFATKFGLKNMVVIYADVFALTQEQGEKEVLYILAHEFAHIKRKHVGFGWLLMPGLAMPFIGSAYSRACEFTCDRYGAYYSQSYKAAKNALVLLAVGPQLYTRVDQTVYTQQIAAENGIFSWIDELLSTHPNLPLRIHALDLFFNKAETQAIQPSKKGIILGVVSLMALSVLVIGGSIWGINQLEKLFNDETLAMDDYSYQHDSTTMNDLMLAVVDNDMDTLSTLEIDAAMLGESNSEGYTALHLAVIEDNYDAATYLLEQGANPDTIDLYEYTPLMDAATSDNRAMTELLLSFGADKTITNSSGNDASNLALEFGYEELAVYIDSY